MASDFYVRQDCRLCGGDTTTAFELIPTPLANEFVTSEFVQSGQIQDIYPLRLNTCHRCGHVQLPVVVNPERLFRKYLYVSGTSPVNIEHFRNYAIDLIRDYSVQLNDLVVEIGSNDGTFLRAIVDNGVRGIGVDPAINIAEVANDSGIQTIPEFFSERLASKILEQHGPAKLIVANNVFAHIDNLIDIVKGISILLANDGVFVFEVSYLPAVIDQTLFDTVYHEHLDYHHIGSFVPFFQRFGLKLFDATINRNHGGTLRAFVGRSDRVESPAMLDLLTKESDLGLWTPQNPSKDSINPICRLSWKVTKLKNNLRKLLSSFQSVGNKIAGYGAPAKVTTLMHQFDLDNSVIDFIVEDAPLKQGLFTPGKFIPVLSPQAIYERQPDYVVILAWNFAESIIRNHRAYLENGGKFIVPIPDPIVISKENI
jgi:SAM-dependent methyltransferase